MNKWIHIGIILAIGCTSELPSTVRENELDPFRVDEMELSAEDRQGVLERRAIFLANQNASSVFEDIVNIEFNTLNIDAHFSDIPLTPGSDREGEVEYGTSMAIVVDPTTPAGSSDLGPTECAFAADLPTGDSTVSCRELAAMINERVADEQPARFAANPLPTSFLDGAARPSEVQGWYSTAFQFGLDSGRGVLIGALREAAACDTEPTAAASAFERGAVEGRRLMETRTAEREAATPATVCNFDTGIVNPAQSAAMGDVPTLSDTPLCDGYVAVDAGERGRLERAQGEFGAGILAGIREQALVESARLVRTRICQPPESDGGGGGGGSGDPLLLDFDGDGLLNVESIALGARFDFGAGPVRTEWPIGDALLVLDNGDGRIEAGELFGDVSEFDDGTVAADGLDAAAIYDSVERGGDNNGRLDMGDAIYGELSVWVDLDGDAELDAGELTSLSDAGVEAIDYAHGRWFDADGDEHVIGDVWLQYRN